MVVPTFFNLAKGFSHLIESSNAALPPPPPEGGGASAGGGSAIAAGLGSQVFKATLKGSLIGAAVVGATALIGSAFASKFTDTNEFRIKDLTK